MHVDEFRKLVAKKKGPPQSRKSKNEYGVKFDSIPERLFYEALVQMNQPFDFQVHVELIGPTIPKESPQKKNPILLFKDRCAEAVTLTIDFVFYRDGVKYIVDVKGEKKLAKRDSKMRYDILKHQIHAKGESRTTRVLFVSDAEVRALSKAAFYAPQRFWEMFLKIKER